MAAISPRFAAASAPAPHSTSWQNEVVSPWIYIAGLCVTACGLYAAGLSLETPWLTVISCLLATLGSVLSYYFRRKGIRFRFISMPILLVATLVMLASISSGRGIPNVIPPSAASDRFRALEAMFAWLATLQCFTLATDSAVLFSCVPCITLLALATTTVSDTSVADIYPFFISAGAFLIVHESFIRTQSIAHARRGPSRRDRFFGTQVILSFGCVALAMVIANYIGPPIRAFGQALYIANMLGPVAAARGRRPNTQGINVIVAEQAHMEIGTGPVTETNIPLLVVHCGEPGLYWRGESFDLYTGHGFTNTVNKPIWVEPDMNYLNFYRSIGISSRRPIRRVDIRFSIPTSPTELPLNDMYGARLVRQTISVIGGTVSQLYASESIQTIVGPFSRVSCDASGGVAPLGSLSAGAVYSVLSRVPDTSPALLRAAPSDSASVPALIRKLYLESETSDARFQAVRTITMQVTRGLSNNYDRAMAIRDYIARTCQYNLHTGATPADRDCVSYFILDSHEGYCDSFAAAMTMMCRIAGIPARLASGFITGDRQGPDRYLVLERHKHDWTEVFFPHIGWVPFDATEGATDISDRNQDSHDTLGILAWLHTQGIIAPLLAVLAAAILIYLTAVELLFRVRKSTRVGHRSVELPLSNARVVRLYESIEALLARRGYRRPPGMTVDSFVDSLMPTLPAHMQAPLHSLCRQLIVCRYGRVVASSEDVRQAELDCAQLRRAIKGLAAAGKAAPGIRDSQPAVVSRPLGTT